MPLSAGDLRHQITIQDPPNKGTVDAAGEPVQNWTNFATNIYAKFVPLQGRELEAARMLHSEVTCEWDIRYRAGVSAKQRVVFVKGGVTRYFAIQFVQNPDEGTEELKLFCSEGLRTG